MCEMLTILDLINQKDFIGQNLGLMPEAQRGQPNKEGEKPNQWLRAAKKSSPLSFTMMKAGKSSTSMRHTASMPSSGYSRTST